MTPAKGSLAGVRVSERRYHCFDQLPDCTNLTVDTADQLLSSADTVDLVIGNLTGDVVANVNCIIDIKLYLIPGFTWYQHSSTVL
jgi:hypothetical protein